jgi:hypothetical protein
VVQEQKLMIMKGDEHMKLRSKFMISSLVVFFTLLPLIALNSAAAPETRTNTYFVHGNAVEPENYNGNIFLRRYGDGTKATATGARWFNLAMTTPVKIEDTTLQLDSFCIQFKTQYCIITKVELYDRDKLMASWKVDDFAGDCSDPWACPFRLVGKNVLDRSSEGGLNISVLVSFSNWDWEKVDWDNFDPDNNQSEWNEIPYIQFVAAGAMFYRSWGGGLGNADW